MLRPVTAEAEAAAEEAAVRAVVQGGDATAFATLAERHRSRLQVHCYRMVGSVDDAEDLVQETLLRAWRGRAGFEGRSRFGTWLYRIATNVCLDAIADAPRRVLPPDVAAPVTLASDWSNPPSSPPNAPQVPWLQPYPDHLLEPAAPREDEPEAALAARETIELAYLAALQHLSAQQRGVLILRDVLAWSAAETADALEMTVHAVNSMLRRARAIMRACLPAERDEWTRSATPTDAERELLRRFVDAWNRADTAAVVALVSEEARWAMPPAPLWFSGRDAIAKLLATFPITYQGDSRMVATAANRQPAAATYVRAPGAAHHQLVALSLLRIERGKIAEITTFGSTLLGGLGLAPAL